MTATFAFIHGAGDVGWYWHLVEADLRGRGHETVAPDLPIEDDRAGLTEYADVVIDAIGSRPDVVVVAQSFGGYVAPIVAEKVGARLIVLVAAMVPIARRNRGGDVREHGLAAGESRGLERAIRLLPRRPVGARGSRRSRTSDVNPTRPGRQPWPLPAWPDIPTRFVLCRNDRFFPARWLRPVVRDRLGIDPDEIESGHCPALSGHTSWRRSWSGPWRNSITRAVASPTGRQSSRRPTRKHVSTSPLPLSSTVPRDVSR